MLNFRYGGCFRISKHCFFLIDFFFELCLLVVIGGLINVCCWMNGYGRITRRTRRVCLQFRFVGLALISMHLVTFEKKNNLWRNLAKLDREK